MTKKITKTLTILFLSISFILPASASAQNIAERQEAFCALVKSRQASVNDSFARQIETYEQALNLAKTKHQYSRSKSAEAIIQARTRADHKRSASYELIKSKQATEENRQLTEKYAAKVEEAIKVRREAFDRARSEFQKEVDRILGRRDDTLRKAVNEFQEVANNAFNTAENDCNNNKPSDRPRIRQTAINRLTDARLDFDDMIKARQDFKSAVRSAARTRKQAYDDAVAEFERSMRSIRTEFSSLQN